MVGGGGGGDFQLDQSEGDDRRRDGSTVGAANMLAIDEDLRDCSSPHDCAQGVLYIPSVL